MPGEHLLANDGACVSRSTRSPAEQQEQVQAPLHAARGASARPWTLFLSGGDVECPNLGVVALGLGSITGLRQSMPQARILLHSFECHRTVRVQLGSEQLDLEAVPVWCTRSLLSRSSVRHLSLAGRVARCIGPWFAGYNRSLRQLLDCDAMLDISGGDSFADIYGQERFEMEAMMKLLASDLGKPLVLLPQTFGPFTRKRSVELARRIIEYSCVAATRDVGGIEELSRVLGKDIADRTVSCPDVAFLLEAVPVEASAEPFVLQRDDRPLIGLNLSGLLYFGDDRFGLRESYSALMRAVADWAVNRARGRVLLVPHVLNWQPLEIERQRLDSLEEASDPLACSVAMEQWKEAFGDRLGQVRGRYGPAQIKYLAGKCDFFIGARMHACIGAVSQGVPTVTLAYSKKASGVMGHLGMSQAVLDLRELSTEHCIEKLSDLYDRRVELAEQIRQQLPRVQGQVKRFFKRTLVESLKRAGGGSFGGQLVEGGSARAAG